MAKMDMYVRTAGSSDVRTAGSSDVRTEDDGYVRNELNIAPLMIT